MKYSDLFSIETGKYFEGEILYAARSYMKKNGQEELFVSTTGTEDINQGTDAIVFGVPIDFTCNFSAKDHMIKLTQVVKIAEFEIDVQFGIRTGNSHKGFSKFDEPVLVIGVSSDPSIMNKICDQFIDAMVKKMSNIFDLGIDGYYEYIDAMY